MKRVRIVVAGMPAALGMAIPLAAQAPPTAHPPVRSSHRFHLDDVGNCISPGGIGDCFSIRGGEPNTINSMLMYYWSKAGYAFVGYRDVPGYPAKSKWRDDEMSPGSRGWGYKWGPGCSFPTGTMVYGWTNYKEPHRGISFSIHGSTFTGKHKCA
jgi:hypothetical protein